MTTTTIDTLSQEARVLLALDKLPLGERDRKYLLATFAQLDDESVTEDGLDELYSTPYGRKLASQWNDASGVPLIRYADDRAAKKLYDFGWFDPIPGREHVAQALEAAAEEWAEELS
ncbi:hypothetical protein ACI7YT_12450 [Microbacterium sp. M]|uniref:hypothetical protein n=1 Tax=Microbacterium sp. M TaxID=3377125 RepID=UPI00386F5EC7